jgi:patatin-like phospholipase/acyl hydrolase
MARAKKASKTAAGAKLTRVLSIDGGGIRGILPGQILVKLEEFLRAKEGNQACIADYFDLVAGTSTGGILTCAYLCPDDPASPDPRPKFTAKEAVDIYLDRGDEIFDVSFWQKLKSAGGLLDEKYSADALEDSLQDYFGETRLSQLLKPCLVTAYDIRRRRAHFFTKHDADQHDSKDFLVQDVARATSAAPTYFELPRIKSMSRITYPLVDGGVFANNPTMCAYAEVRTMDFSPQGRPKSPKAREMLILSLGTGKTRTPFAYNQAKDWGKVGWIQPLIDILMTGNSDTVDYQLTQMFDAVEAPDQYLRIDPILGDASPEMDNGSVENLEALREAGTESAENHAEELEEFADLLIANK